MTTTLPQIELVDIEKELKRLWDEEEGKSKTRACLFNLIIYTKKSNRDELWRQRVHSVITQFPSRVIYIFEEREEIDVLKTTVSTEMVAPDIFCEVIQINAGGSLLERVPSIVLPLIVPDLHLYLLWAEDPSEDKILLPTLEPYAKRIIFDAKSTRNFENFTKEISSLVCRFRCEIGDLNWSALKGWRNTFATYFEAKELVEALVHSKKITIVYNKIEERIHAEIRPIYFQGWLASLLNWKYKNISLEGDKIRLFYEHEKPLEIELIPHKASSELFPGALTNIEIESWLKNTHFTFKRPDFDFKVMMQHSDDTSCSLPTYTNVYGPHEGNEIIHELFYTHVGKHYRKMIEFISQIPWGKR